MTDISPPIQNAEQTLASRLALSNEAPIFNGNLAPTEPPIEDDSTIKCICGYNDDDGNTVFCEDCNTWQHIECYYPNVGVPEVHQCVNCKPRPIDASAAADRQRQARTAPLTTERKQKRAPTKSHKKKPKDNPTVLPVNGISGSDRFGHDRTSGSPHDPPPAKRPKTTHRPSSSTTSIVHPNQVSAVRRRTNSVAISRASPTKSSPSSPNGVQSADERYSPHFMQLYEKEWTQTESNSFYNLATTDALSSWLNDSEQFEKVAKGKTQHDVYSRWDKPMSELKSMSPGVRDVRSEDHSVMAHGRHPLYIGLAVEHDTAEGSFLGELNGLITLKTDYELSSSLWPILRHPEPFVFYSDKLPICIDARKEGSRFRFIRRSCQPNARMQIIIVGQEYRFCLVSSQSIAQDDEITIPWYIDPKVLDISKALIDKKPVSSEDCEYRARWVAGVLAHFGDCACNRPKDQCVFNLAGIPRLQAPEPNGQPLRTVKKKARRNPQVSPLSTGRATNSRAGSEAVNNLDADDDVVESRSVSGSIRSKVSSRDNTPTTTVNETSIGLGVELSSREQRKILEQERLFAQMEMDGSKRRKRNSAGSALNTPSVSTSKQLGHLEPFNPSPTSVSSSGKQRVNGRGVPEHRVRTINPSRISITSMPAPSRQRSYTESSTQTDGGAEDVVDDSHVTQLRRSTGCTFAQKLLRRTRKHKARMDRRPREIGADRAPTPASSAESSVETRQDTPSKGMPPPPLPAHLSKTQEVQASSIQSPEEQSEPKDVEMPDILHSQPEPEPEESPASKHETETAAKPNPPLISQTSNLSITDQPETIPTLASWKPDPPDPAYTTNDDEPIPSPTPPPAPIEQKHESAPSSKPNLTLQTTDPPTPNANIMEVAQTPTTPSISSAGPPVAISPTTSGTAVSETPTVVQSPTAVKSAVNSVIANFVASPVAPSPPQKKKLSLSFYTNRLKKKKIEAAQQAAQNSPLSSSISITGATDYLTAKSWLDERVADPSQSTPIDTTSSIPQVSESIDYVASKVDKPLDHDSHPDVQTNEMAVNDSATEQKFSDSSAMDIDSKPEPVKISDGVLSTTTAG